MGESTDTTVGQSPPELAQSTRKGCLSEEAVQNFVRGRSTENERLAVDQHLDVCAPCRDWVSAAARADDAPSVATRLAGAPSEASGPPAHFASSFRPTAVVAQRYEIRRFLARGGMGEVYEAYDRHLHERVAIKTLPSAACDSEEAIRALKAEVQLARRVTHANVCRIYDLGTHRLQSGALLHFLTMEFVEGQTLGRMIRERGPFPIAEAERFARALLMGLGAAHASGILHRDFKSDNIIVRTGPNGEAVPVILDFGLARPLDERSRRTGEHGLAGTLQYMAPEQLEGARLYKATDIYAFGIVWFEMLTGKRPFSGSPQTSVLERFSKAPPPPSFYNPEVPRSLDAIIGRCLRPVPKDRFQAADEVLAALPEASSPSAKPGPGSRNRPLQLAVAASVVAAGLFVALLPEGRTTASKELNTTVKSSYVSTLSRASARPEPAPALPARPSALPTVAQPIEKVASKVTPRLKPVTAPVPINSVAPSVVPSANVPPEPVSAVGSRFRWQNPVTQAIGAAVGSASASAAPSAAGASNF